MATTEDADRKCIEALAVHLRDFPLLPPSPADPSSDWLDPQSGIAIPSYHCAFRGCSWTSENMPCEARSATKSLRVCKEGEWCFSTQRIRNADGIFLCCGSMFDVDGKATCLKEHIVRDHQAVLIESCGSSRITVDSYSYYLEGVCFVRKGFAKAVRS